MSRVIVESMDDQVARGDNDVIDPAGVVSPDSVPIFGGFDHSVDKLLGRATDVRQEGGTLVADVAFRGPLDEKHWRLGVGGIVDEYELDSTSGRLVRKIKRFRLLEVAVVPK